MIANGKWTDPVLDSFKFQGDPLADQVVAGMLGIWDHAEASPHNDSNFAAIYKALASLKPLELNDDLTGRIARDPAAAGQPAGLSTLLAEFETLPAWADLKKIDRAEHLFRENGMISSILFFCACLPEVYVAPDISTVLHATGSLEKITEQRIRATSAMILSVLVPGGLADCSGAGRPKILKARFIHAVMRNLFLRGSPGERDSSATIVAPIPGRTVQENTFRLAFMHGWNPVNEGIPCNQEEQSYTLLTFSYVYLRSLRKLGLGFRAADEEAYLHLWNVVGHFMGIAPAMMAHTMQDAASLFDRLQVRVRQHRFETDPRPALGAALSASIERSISPSIFKAAAPLVIRYLSSKQTAAELGLDSRYSWFSKVVFAGFMQLIKSLDRIVRRVSPDFSFVRFFLRVVGYRLVHKVLTDATNPIDLPDVTRQQINLMLAEWSSDRLAPRWMNAVEDCFTTKGSWSESIGV